jgi:hypothetical protein
MGLYFVYITVIYIAIVFMFLFSLCKRVVNVTFTDVSLFEECIIIPVFDYDNDYIPFQLQLFTERCWDKIFRFLEIGL